MNFGIYSDLTKDYILKRVNQEQIMEKYLGIPLDFTHQFCSPFRKDNNPTCGLYYNDYGKLRMRDLAGYFWGDCFDACAFRLKVDANNKQAFQLILHTIAKDFRIHKYKDYNEVRKYEIITEAFFKKQNEKITTRFNIVPRNYNSYDKLYWDKINVSKQLLEEGKVYFAQEISVSKNNLPFINIYKYKTKDPAYCYWGGKDKNNIDMWKIYFPFRRNKGETRFVSNSSFLQGKQLITCGRVGIITKSYKDVLAFRSLGLQAVAPSAESKLLTKDEFWFMKTKFDYLVSCMDYDRAGMRMAQMLRKIYKIDPIMFTNGRYNSLDFGSKDLTDFISKKGVNEITEIITELFKEHYYDFRKLDKYYYNSLKLYK